MDLDTDMECLIIPWSSFTNPLRCLPHPKMAERIRRVSKFIARPVTFTDSVCSDCKDGKGGEQGKGANYQAGNHGGFHF